MQIRPIKVAMDTGPRGKREMQVTWRTPGFVPHESFPYSGGKEQHEAIIPEWARQAIIDRGLADDDGEVVLGWLGELGHQGYGNVVKTSGGYFEFTVDDAWLVWGPNAPEHLSPDDRKPITLEVPAGAIKELENFARKWFSKEAREFGEELIREHEEPDYEELEELERMDEYEVRGLGRPGQEFL